jgi:hypothetical protein
MGRCGGPPGRSRISRVIFLTSLKGALGDLGDLPIYHCYDFRAGTRSISMVATVPDNVGAAV